MLIKEAVCLLVRCSSIYPKVTLLSSAVGIYNTQAFDKSLFLPRTRPCIRPPVMKAWKSPHTLLPLYHFSRSESQSRVVYYNNLIQLVTTWLRFAPNSFSSWVQIYFVPFYPHGITEERNFTLHLHAGGGAADQTSSDQQTQHKICKYSPTLWLFTVIRRASAHYK